MNNLMFVTSFAYASAVFKTRRDAIRVAQRLLGETYNGEVIRRSEVSAIDKVDYKGAVIAQFCERKKLK